MNKKNTRINLAARVTSRLYTGEGNTGLESVKTSIAADTSGGVSPIYTSSEDSKISGSRGNSDSNGSTVGGSSSCGSS